MPHSVPVASAIAQAGDLEPPTDDAPQSVPGTRGAVCSVRGLPVFVAESGDLLPALPVLVRSSRGAWEHVGDVIDRPEQLQGLDSAPWTSLTRLELRFDGSEVRLTGVAEPGLRPFLLTARDPLGPWSEVVWAAVDGRSARTSAPRTPELLDEQQPSPLRIDRVDFGGAELDFRWRGSTWPRRTWTSDASGMLRAIARTGAPGVAFSGLPVRHRAFAVSTVLHLPPTGGAVEGGIMLRGGARAPVSVGVRSGRSDRLEVVRRHGVNAEVVGVVRAPTQTVRIELHAAAGRVTARIVVAGDRAVGCAVGPHAELARSAVGPYATAAAESAGFTSFEYRGHGTPSC